MLAPPFPIAFQNHVLALARGPAVHIPPAARKVVPPAAGELQRGHLKRALVDHRASDCAENLPVGGGRPSKVQSSFAAGTDALVRHKNRHIPKKAHGAGGNEAVSPKPSRDAKAGDARQSLVQRQVCHVADALSADDDRHADKRLQAFQAAASKAKIPAIPFCVGMPETMRANVFRAGIRWTVFPGFPRNAFRAALQSACVRRLKDG